MPNEPTRSLHCDVAIIGGGAAGLMCAIKAGQRGRRVVVLEHMAEVGKKILISGGGRCNFTNRGASPDQYLSANPHFCKSALARYQPADFISLVRRHGIAYHEKKLGQLFCDQSARQIVTMLEEECRRAGVQIWTGARLERVHKGEAFALSGSFGEMTASSLVVATGGLSIPKLGASDLGYRIARQFGLQVTATRPALVPLLAGPPWRQRLDTLRGIAVDTLVSHPDIQFRENSLFTHWGLSGPAILQASSYWHAGEEIQLNFLPDFELAEHLKAARQAGEQSHLAHWLADRLPRRLVQQWSQWYGFNKPLSRYSDEEIQRIVYCFQAWPFNPAGTAGYAKAEVTAGGIDTRELSSQSMEARKIKGLFFIGEVVDVTGWLGGYNFQWAWASGQAAGQWA